MAEVPAVFHVLAGLSHYDSKAVVHGSFGELNFDTRESTAYSLVTFTKLPWGLRPQLGLSYDTYSQPSRNLSRLNPKLGLLWSLPSGTTIRAAAFRTIKRSVIANQTLQPAQVSGFNQFFDDPNGTLSRRFGLSVDHKAAPNAFFGAEWSSRDLRVPNFPGDPDFRWTERAGRLYFYYILSTRLTATAAYQLERFRRPDENTGNEGFTNLRTALVPLGLRVHALGPWSLSVKGTYVHQKLRHEDSNFNLVDGKESVVIADLSLAYHLDRRGGTIAMEARNLFDRKFRYQEVDIFSSPSFSPSRLYFMRLSLVF